MSARLFSFVETAARTASFSAVAATMYYVDLVTAAANVVVTLPASALVGQCIGVEVKTDNNTNVVTFTANVDADVPPLSMAGDYVLLTWSGTSWRLVSCDTGPGFLDSLGGATAVGLYRLFNTTATTDYSGNARSLTIQAGVLRAPGLRPGTFSLRRASGFIATQNNAAFQLQGAMAAIWLVNVCAINPNSVFWCACGDGTGLAVNNIQWGLLQSNIPCPQYTHENGAGVDVNYQDTSIGLVVPGWQTWGFTRTAGGVVTLYLNGAASTPSVALALPTGGGSSVMAIGALSNNTLSMAPSAGFSQLGVYSTALTAAQHQRAARQLLGYRFAA